jgi:hypothetical protein
MNSRRVILGLTWLLVTCNACAQTCSYNTWRWNVRSKLAVQHERVVRPYHLLRADERDLSTGCTVCEEDQVKLEVTGLPTFYLCKFIAPQVRTALTELHRQGAPIKTVIGYRVGRSRGEVDAQGNRSVFSNHSFGVALDINTDHNGLYTQCVHFGPQCLLSRGGTWQPLIDPYSLTTHSPIVRALKASGLKWGGEIAGQQKDFMHFSPSGY